MLLDLLVIVVVTAVAVSMNIVFAVIIGVAVTVLFFLFRMSKSVIRRSYRCDTVHSRKTRDRLARDGKFLLLSAFEERPRLTKFLQDMGVLTAITPDRLFQDTERTTRLVTFAPGTVFGELALLGEQPRSATVEADDDLVCYVLSHQSFVMLTQRDPAVAIKLLTNLSRELAGRLRRTTRTVYQLAI